MVLRLDTDLGVGSTVEGLDKLVQEIQDFQDIYGAQSFTVRVVDDRQATA